jgi:hypothetical protein
VLHENRSAKFVLSMIHPSSIFQSRLSIVQSVLSMDHLSFPNGPLRSAMPLQIVVVITRSPLPHARLDTPLYRVGLNTT